MSGGVLLQFKVWVGLPVKLRVTFTKIRWELTEKVRIDFVKSGLIPPSLPSNPQETIGWISSISNIVSILILFYLNYISKLKKN